MKLRSWIQSNKSIINTEVVSRQAKAKPEKKRKKLNEDVV
jgi:hypothetical protein